MWEEVKYCISCAKNTVNPFERERDTDRQPIQRTTRCDRFPAIGFVPLKLPPTPSKASKPATSASNVACDVMVEGHTTGRQC